MLAHISFIGATAVTPIQAPLIYQSLETRAIRIRPDVVLACNPADNRLSSNAVTFFPSTASI